MATVAPTQTVTLTTQATVTPEGFVLPPEATEKLPPKPGCRVRITIHPSPPARAQVHGRAEELVQKLRTMLGKGPSLEDEYLRSRDKDKQ